MRQIVLTNLTIDVGTTNTKVSLWSEQTNIQPIQQVKFATPKNKVDDFVDFDTEKLLKQLMNSIRQLVKAAPDSNDFGRECWRVRCFDQ